MLKIGVVGVGVAVVEVEVAECNNCTVLASSPTWTCMQVKNNAAIDNNYNKF